MAITTIVFDIGRVLFEYNPGKIIDTILPKTSHRDAYMAHLFLAEIWQELDRGMITEAQAIATLAQISSDSEWANGLPLLLDRFVYELDLIEKSKSIFLSVQKRYPVYLLSNFQSDPFDKLVQAHPFLALANGAVVSAKIRMMKPEPAIYTHLLTTYSLNSAETLFIDDLVENIEGAKAAGMHGIVFTDPDQLIADLKTFEIICDDI